MSLSDIPSILGLLFGVLVILCVYSSAIYVILKVLRNSVHRTEFLILFFYIFSWILFAIGWNAHESSFNEVINTYRGFCYQPFSGEHLAPWLALYVVYIMTQLSLWLGGKNFSPIIMVAAMIISYVGLAVNALIILQTSFHDQSTLGQYACGTGPINLLTIAPAFTMVLTISLLVITIKNHTLIIERKNYKNDLLDSMNAFVHEKINHSLHSLLLSLPILLIFVLLLILLGQDPDNFAKVVTDTTTWRYSQQAHPPVLEQQSGHYLCTVAAKGNPEVVKPLFIGRRHGTPIIVNRQLQIANAFEALIEIKWPRLHKGTRTFYDEYGYNLSTRINDERNSNLTYLLMKPLEWFFLIVLYTCCRKPEVLIKKQYA